MGNSHRVIGLKVRFPWMSDVWPDLTRMQRTATGAPVDLTLIVMLGRRDDNGIIIEDVST